MHAESSTLTTTERAQKPSETREERKILSLAERISVKVLIKGDLYVYTALTLCKRPQLIAGSTGRGDPMKNE